LLNYDVDEIEKSVFAMLQNKCSCKIDYHIFWTWRCT